MRVIGVVFLADAVLVWWFPLGVAAQSLVLGVLGLAAFALHSMMRSPRRVGRRDGRPELPPEDDRRRPPAR